MACSRLIQDGKKVKGREMRVGTRDKGRRSEYHHTLAIVVHAVHVGT